MLRIDILSVNTSILNSFLNTFIIKRAKKKKIINLFIHDIRKYGIGKNKKIDDYQYGGGYGMVLKIEPIYKWINNLKKKIFYDEVIFLSPDGEKLNQLMVNNISKKKNLIIICGHYKGIDQRIRDNLVTKEISIGDYVISCGEIASIVLIDSIIRILPGVINKKSFVDDSIQNGLKTSYPIYTRPYKYKNWKVPNVLISGNHKKIKEWRKIKLLKNNKNIFKKKNKKNINKNNIDNININNNINN